MSDQPNMEAALSEAWGDWVPPAAYDDSPNWQTSRRGGRWISRPQDRERGKFAPFFETEQDLAMIRGQARWLAGFSEIAIGAIHNLTNYILGTGFAYEVAPVKGADGGEQAAKAAQAIIDEFHKANDWRQLERELFERSIIDGEFVTVMEEYNGGAVVKIAEPDYLTEPLVTADLDEYLGYDSLDWLFGVASHWGNTCARAGYYIDWEGRNTDWRVYPSWQVEHFRRNVPRGVKRGLSDLYAVEQWLERAYKVLRNTAEGAAIQAAIAYVKEHSAGTSAAQATSLAGARLNTVNTQKPALRGGTSPITAKKFGPGTILELSNGQKFVPGPMGSERAPNFLAIQQAVLRAVGSRWSMPEYMISGDASNANYASTLVAESPFVKNAEAEQVLYSESFDAIHWKVLRIAYGAGRFSHLGMSWEEIRRAITIDITPPPVSTRNRLEDTQVRSVLHDKGILSPKTWSALEELEFEVEQENLKDYPGNTPAAPSSPLTGTPGLPDTGPPATPAPAPATGQEGGADPEQVAVAGSEQDVQVAPELVLNGAQITAAVAIVTAVAAGEIPRDAGLGQLKVLFNLTDAQATQIMGSAGTSTPTTPNPKPAEVATESRRLVPESVRQTIAQLWEQYP